MSNHKLGRILIVDDEEELMKALVEGLAAHAESIIGKTTVKDALEVLEKEPIDLLLTDLMLPGIDGITLLRQVLQNDPQIVGIIMTGQGSISSAVEAMKLGAFDYILKPFRLQFVLPILQRAMDVRKLKRENIKLKRYVEQLTYESNRFKMIGDSPAMQKVIHLIEKVAGTDATILIRGQSGTGKELVARAIHHNSLRRNKPIVTINCAALQDSLIESELFGYEKGAFTGAVTSKPGLFEVAEGGTLFIDEIAEMPPAMQAKLLRVLENGSFRRLGSIQERYADVRILAATNRPLEEDQKNGRFREDLFYRLNVITITLPPLNQRIMDIPTLIEHFLNHRQIGINRCQIEQRALQKLLYYSWPGNIRELANVIERAQILAENNLITLDDLPENILDESRPNSHMNPESEKSVTQKDSVTISTSLESMEKQHVIRILDQFKGNKVHAARALGISRRAIYRLIDKYHLDAYRKRESEESEEDSTSEGISASAGQDDSNSEKISPVDQHLADDDS